MTNQDDDNLIKETMNTIPLSSGLSNVEAEKLVPILLPAVTQCREILAKEGVGDQQFIQYIVGAAAMAAAKLLQQDHKD